MRQHFTVQVVSGKFKTLQDGKTGTLCDLEALLVLQKKLTLQDYKLHIKI